jgi:tetratricopeptide (TPR) repeat protein
VDLRILLSAMAIVALTGVARAQTAPPPSAPSPIDPAAAPNSAILGINGGDFGSVAVYLRTEDTRLLPQNVTVTISIVPVEGGTPLSIVPRLVGEGWWLDGVRIGNEYKLTVVATGYIPAQERVRLPNTPGASSTVIVFMRPIGQELVFHPPAGQFVLAPRAEKEIQHALQDLQSGKVGSAQKHTQTAIRISPDNPYPQYVMGLSYLLTNRPKEAKPYLEKSVSIDSRQPLSLRALGTVRYRLGDDAGAVTVLTKAVQLDGTSWKAEWLLASAYFNEKKYAEARDHAEQALKIGKHEADHARLVLGAALADLGERQEAAKLFDAFAAEFPNDPDTPTALKWAKLMREPQKASALPEAEKITGTAEPPVEVPPRPDWAPPDVDAVEPFVVSDAVCPLPQVLKAAGKTAEQLVSTLQEFTATEDFQDIEIKRGGQLEKPSEHAFKYLVFIEQVSPQAFDVKESRNNGSGEVQLPVRIADTGVPALALAFHPMIQPDLDWKCEGLGTWDNQSAWVVHFRQKPKQPNVLAWFSSPLHSYSLPLKGRAWVSERSGEVLHLETDLVDPIEAIDLERQHYSIDYKQVSFHAHDVDLWLPENVDTYFQYRGHFLHYYHHFTDFQLFWVGASQKIGVPKSTEPKEEPQQRP